MNALEKYLKLIDESSYDHTDAHVINSGFQEVCKQLIKDGENELAEIADLDRQVFSVQKSFDYKKDAEKGTINGLSWQISGTRTLEDGSQMPLYWPDVANYTVKDFEYFEKRYNECNNLFAKTEYGLMAYFGQRTPSSRHNDFKRQLCSELFELTKHYLSRTNGEPSDSHSITHFFLSLRLTIGIAEKSNLEPESTNLVRYIYNKQQNWDISNEYVLPALLNLSAILSDYFSLSNKIIDFQKVIAKNMEAAEEFKETDIWGVMSLVDHNLIIEQKRNNLNTDLLVFKAKLYERLAKDAENNRNLACVGFAENALRIYQQAKLPDDINRLEKYYSELRGKFGMMETSVELLKEHVDNMNEHISNAVAQNDERGIIQHFIDSPWYDTIKDIKHLSEKSSKETVLLSMLPTSIVDKFGNTVDTFSSEIEKKEFNFWHTYAFSFQIGTRTMLHFFMEAYKAKKLSYNSVLSYLEGTWYNETIERKYHGRIVEVKPIDTLKPGLERFFEELGKFSEDNSYRCDFVTVIDSLTLKVEGLLRYFCEKIGIATFKTRQKGSQKLVMEKLLDDLLADIAHQPSLRPEQKTYFDEEDRILIKYVLAEKVGLNLRNEVAHGLMDIFEYTFERIVILFCIIIKLSKYKFIEAKGGTDESSS